MALPFGTRLPLSNLVNGVFTAFEKCIPFENDPNSSLGQALGAESSFRGLGIFFDTYSNHNGEHGHEHPYISAMVSNGSVIYDHDHDGTQTQLAGCHSPFRNKDHKTYTRIQYSRDTLKVYPCFLCNANPG